MAQQLPTEQSDLAKYGISLLINNHSVEAQDLFKENMDSIQMSAGYSFVTFMDALTSFEDEKLQLALNVLRETERKCATDIGWLKTMKTKMFGRIKCKNLAERLENQIILGDTQVCVAILMFLQQEFTGYLKGGWVLRKAWKIYQQTYTEIVEIYKHKFGDFNLPEPTDFEWNDYTCAATLTGNNIDDSTEWTVPDISNRSRNGYVVPFSNLSQSQSSYSFPKTMNQLIFNMKRSDSAHSSFASNNNNNNNNNYRKSFSLLSPLSTQLTYLTSTLSLLSFTNETERNDISPETISRLMGAVCFGYGVLQLGLSLLPPSLMKVTNFFGYHANRADGISNLMYARKVMDMRAPLAVLALLWYHTIVRPFYALDGTNVKAGVEAACLLIEESQSEYAQSALFLFFKGRIHRLDSNIPLALKSFQSAVNNSNQREIKLLALHEVGWCHLISLNYKQAQKVFQQLKQSSRWSRAFYAFLTVICSGSCGQKDFSGIKHVKDLNGISKMTQLDLFLQRRLHVFPQDEDSLKYTTSMFWKFFVFELLYLWNALPSCTTNDINEIIIGLRTIDSVTIIVLECNEISSEPMPGLAMLIQGECYHILGDEAEAIISFRNCILQRSHLTSNEYTHISACSEFALGTLLLKQPETKEEGKSLLQHAARYKDYDFDNKLHVRIDMILKNVS